MVILVYCYCTIYEKMIRACSRCVKSQYLLICIINRNEINDKTLQRSSHSCNIIRMWFPARNEVAFPSHNQLHTRRGRGVCSSLSSYVKTLLPCAAVSKSCVVQKYFIALTLANVQIRKKRRTFPKPNAISKSLETVHLNIFIWPQ